MTNSSRTRDDLLPGLDDGPGPAVPIADARASAMIAAAITGGLPPTGSGPEGTGGGGGAVTGASATSAAIKVGIAVALVGTLAITAFVVTRDRDATPGPATAPPAVAATPAPPAPAIKALPPDPPAVIPAPVATEPTTPDTTRTTPPAHATPRQPTRAAASTPDDLLRQANQARKARAWSDANALYRRVMRTHRGSRAAYVATVASAQLNLGTLGNPSAALGLFQRALAKEPRGFLAEESRFGVAEAHRKLGNRAAEAKALARFLRDHARSPLAPRARARLSTLKADNSP